VTRSEEHNHERRDKRGVCKRASSEEHDIERRDRSDVCKRAYDHKRRDINGVCKRTFSKQRVMSFLLSRVVRSLLLCSRALLWL